MSFFVKSQRHQFYVEFQGMVVAILFCLINNEVLMELKKFFGQHIEPFNGPQSIAMTQYTVRIL